MENLKQATFFSAEDYKSENWCWIVEIRYENQEYGVHIAAAPWSEWCIHPGRPNHYRSELRAHEVLQTLQAQYKRKIELGLVELRVEPKYIGYIPGSGETWIE